MNFSELYASLNEAERYQALNFAADPILKKLVFQRLSSVMSEINDTSPENADPIEYTRRMQDLHARKEELRDLNALLQQIANQNKPKQEGK